MQRLFFITIFIFAPFLRTWAQDTVIFNGQPTGDTVRPILDNCFFFEDSNDVPLNFNAVRQQHFVPYADSLRKDKLLQRPLLIQWIRFTVHNISGEDTVRLRLDPGGHFFVELYDDHGFIAKAGIYEPAVSGLDRAAFNIVIKPNSIRTFWLRNVERQNHFLPPWVSLDTPLAFLQNHYTDIWHSRLLFLLLSMLTGCLFFITIFAAYQFFLYRDKAFLWYMAYTLSAGFTGLFWIDIRHQFGMFRSSLYHELIFSVFLFFIPVLYSLFIGKMLHLPKHFKKGWLIVKILLVVACLQMIIEFTTIRTGRFIFTNYYGYFISMFPVTILNLILLVLAARSTEKVKWFMFSGLLSMLLLWCLPLMFSSHLRFSNNTLGYVFTFVPFYFLLGLAIEALCFSFALSYRSKLVFVEKNQLQKQYYNQLQTELNKRSEELEAQNLVVEQQKMAQVQTVFEKKIAEMEMTALRAQMNPHFIFNCLNSIKLYTLENDAKTASEYLTMFSQLIRLVLENSRSEKVTLQKELETVRLYIELEAMRFKNKVAYRIHVSPDIDAEYTELPPLLIQPYVENAVWHGLMHKKEGGNVAIAVTQPSTHCLQVEITDDGVGREAAALFKSKSATTKKSFGLKVTSERLDMIQEAYGIKTNIQVTDLKDKGNKATGTRVILHIPI